LAAPVRRATSAVRLLIAKPEQTSAVAVRAVCLASRFLMQASIYAQLMKRPQSLLAMASAIPGIRFQRFRRLTVLSSLKAISMARLSIAQFS
jgi:hypothetical protein